MGNVDGDPNEEIIVGLGAGSHGWVEIFDDAAAAFAHRAWIDVPWFDYNYANGLTWPAAGDLDGDQIDEIVVGLGAGGAGWIAVFGHELDGYSLQRWLQIPWDTYNTAVGETHPAVGNVDGDQAAEIVAGLGAYVGNGGWFQVFDDLGDGQGSALAWGRGRVAGVRGRRRRDVSGDRPAANALSRTLLGTCLERAPGLTHVKRSTRRLQEKSHHRTPFSATASIDDVRLVVLREPRA